MRASMTAGDQALRVTIELDANADAIHGILEHDGGRRERFWGWLDLMAAVERIASATRTSETRRRATTRTVGWSR